MILGWTVCQLSTRPRASSRLASRQWTTRNGTLRRSVRDGACRPVRQIWDFILPIAPVTGSLGIFGHCPSGNVPDTATMQTRLIDLVGRRP